MWLLEEVKKIVHAEREAEHRLWEVFEFLKHHFRHYNHSRAVKGRILCFYTISPTGDIIMAGQSLTVGIAYTAPIVFTGSAGDTVKGPPQAVVALSIPANGTIATSADRQSINVTLSVAGDVDISYTANNEAGNPISVPSVTVTGVAPDVAVSGVIGTFVPGTTA